AKNYHLPIILHNREAIEDLFQIIYKWKNDLPPSRNGKPSGVFHAFSEDLNWAKQITQMGFYIGVGGVITYPKANLLREVVRSIPRENILVETDAPFLPPQPLRGKRNEPAYLSIIVNELSKELNLDSNILVEVTHQNSNRLFGIN
ncbi:MAG: TatD family hydrolase, partial [Anaerolineales bacterium]